MVGRWRVAHELKEVRAALGLSGRPRKAQAIREILQLINAPAD